MKYFAVILIWAVVLAGSVLLVLIPIFTFCGLGSVNTCPSEESFEQVMTFIPIWFFSLPIWLFLAYQSGYRTENAVEIPEKQNGIDDV